MSLVLIGSFGSSRLTAHLVVESRCEDATEENCALFDQKNSMRPIIAFDRISVIADDVSVDLSKILGNG